MTSEIKPEDVKLPAPAAWLEIDEDRLGRPIYKAVHSTPDAIVGEHRRARVFTADQVRAAVLEDRQRRALSDDDLRLILDKLENYDDCGPPGEGWQSDELSRLVAKLSAAIRAGHSVTETPLGEG